MPLAPFRTLAATPLVQNRPVASAANGCPAVGVRTCVHCVGVNPPFFTQSLLSVSAPRLTLAFGPTLSA